MIHKITFEQAKAFMDTNARYRFWDVREEEEYVTGHAIGAELFILDTINKETALNMEPDLTMPILVYCRSGRRSARAAQILENIGYREIYDMGGLIGWPYGLE